MANKSKHVTMEEVNKNWDDWWNSLTDSQKQKLVEEQEAMEKDSDDECRVFYVGATRARNQLHIVQPQREGGFII